VDGPQIKAVWLPKPTEGSLCFICMEACFLFLTALPGPGKKEKSNHAVKNSGVTYSCHIDSISYTPS